MGVDLCGAGSHKPWVRCGAISIARTSRANAKKNLKKNLTNASLSAMMLFA
jgi:hypothetical protein